MSGISIRVTRDKRQVIYTNTEKDFVQCHSEVALQPKNLQKVIKEILRFAQNDIREFLKQYWYYTLVAHFMSISATSARENSFGGLFPSLSIALTLVPLKWI